MSIIQHPAACWGHQRFRADRASGFYELTAVSHIGPAMAYLAQIKANGECALGKGRLELLRTARAPPCAAFNLRRDGNRLDRLDQPAWAARKTAIRDMIDYACAQHPGVHQVPRRWRRVQHRERQRHVLQWRIAAVSLFHSSTSWSGMSCPCWKRSRGAVDVQKELGSLNLDWPRAMVLVSSRAGSNVSSGLTEGTNWLVLFLKAASGFALPDERVKIVPYAEVRSTLGGARLSPADLAGTMRAASLGSTLLSPGCFRSGVFKHTNHLPAGAAASAGGRRRPPRQPRLISS